jgi:hypothetical protein
MKKPVMRREMFIAMAPKSGSKGIMSGFDDEMEIEDYEDRTPENLEIIANNLRGDIRSMDERYLELAQMVGESAFETPEEVVALMQSQMGQQQPPPQSASPCSGTTTWRHRCFGRCNCSPGSARNHARRCRAHGPRSNGTTHANGAGWNSPSSTG